MGAFRRTQTASSIDGRARELLEARNFCHVTTLRADGTAHVVCVWVDTDGEYVILNSAEGRAWVRNLESDPRVVCTVQNRENPSEYVSVRGHLVELTYDGAEEHIDSMALKYNGVPGFRGHEPGRRRVLLRIAPERIFLRPGVTRARRATR